MDRLVPRGPRRQEWSGPRHHCPLCGATLDMIIERGRKVYECGTCLRPRLPFDQDGPR